MIFSSDDLPEPFSPSTPIFAPGKEIERDVLEDGALGRHGLRNPPHRVNVLCHDEANDTKNRRRGRRRRLVYSCPAFSRPGAHAVDGMRSSRSGAATTAPTCCASRFIDEWRKRERRAARMAPRRLLGVRRRPVGQPRGEHRRHRRRRRCSASQREIDLRRRRDRLPPGLDAHQRARARSAPRSSSATTSAPACASARAGATTSACACSTSRTAACAARTRESTSCWCAFSTTLE